MLKITNGASLQPLSGAAPRQIVLLLHGYGSRGSDMIALAPAWQARLPDALFLAPNAPQRCGGGYQWWGLANFDPQALAGGAAQAAPAIDEFIDRKLTQYQLTEAQLVIVGFSQGTMMALHVGLRRARTVAAIVGYSGMFTGPAGLRDDSARPPVLLVHGALDAVVPVSAMASAQRALEKLGVPVTTHVSAGVAHGVDPAGIQIGCDFAAKALATSVRA